jgi:hypothetical protein
MRIAITVFLIINIFANAFKTINACGNSYYITDAPLPLKDGFLDYNKMFQNNSNEFEKRHEINAYFAVYRDFSSYEFRNPVYYDIKDSLLKLCNLKDSKVRYKISDFGLYNLAKSKKADYKYLSDFAWQLARSFKIKEAKLVLEDLYKSYPNEYNIVANLGTVYELSGQNKLALTYIEKAVALDSDSHYGSEWIHINILKQKCNLPISNLNFCELKIMNIYDDKHYTQNQNKVDSSFARYRLLCTSNKLATQLANKHRDTVLIHLAYQLHERMYFIKGKDPIMATLVDNFIDLMLHRKDYEYLSPMLKFKEYYSKLDSYDFLKIDYVIKSLALTKKPT